jgi:hypothetical protein
MLEVPGPPTASGPAADHPFAFHTGYRGLRVELSRGHHEIVISSLHEAAYRHLRGSGSRRRKMLPSPHFRS